MNAQYGQYTIILADTFFVYLSIIGGYTLYWTVSYIAEQNIKTSTFRSYSTATIAVLVLGWFGNFYFGVTDVPWQEELWGWIRWSTYIAPAYFHAVYTTRNKDGNEKNHWPFKRSSLH